LTDNKADSELKDGENQISDISVVLAYSMGEGKGSVKKSKKSDKNNNSTKHTLIQKDGHHQKNKTQTKSKNVTLVTLAHSNASNSSNLS
jgi:hypothetical protein